MVRSEKLEKLRNDNNKIAFCENFQIFDMHACFLAHNLDTEFLAFYRDRFKIM